MTETKHEEFRGVIDLDGNRVQGELWRMDDRFTFIFGDASGSTLEISGKTIGEIKNILRGALELIKQSEL